MRIQFIHSKYLSPKPTSKNLSKRLRPFVLGVFGLSLYASLHTSPVEAIALSSSDIPVTFKFTKTLRQGDTVTPDVSYLQFVLNQSGDTQVSTSGAGSPENLTNYFGAKTKSAVQRFQEKFRDEILTPANIISPTGIVGERTRTKLNQILSGVPADKYLDSNSDTPTTSALASANAANQTKVFVSSLSDSTSDNSINSSSNSTKAPIISSFSTFRALSGQLMSLFGAQFHPTKNTLYLGSENIGVYPSLENGSKITFKVPEKLETGSYEVGVVNTYGTTSTGYMYLGVTKPIVSTTTPVIRFDPSLVTIYPNTSNNINDLVFLYGDNFSFNNTLETNLGNTIVRSTNRKTLSFMISELPYYMDAFKKYRGKSINILIKLRNENGLSQEQLVHVIQFPNSNIPTVNTTLQEAPDSFDIASTTDDAVEMAFRRLGESTAIDTATSTASNTSSSVQNSPTGTSNNKPGTDPTSTVDSLKPQADPILEQLRKESPVHKFLSDPLVSSEGSGSNSDGGASGGSAGGGIVGAIGKAVGGAAAKAIGKAVTSGLGGGSAAGGASGAIGASGGAGGSKGGSNSKMTDFGGKITESIICTCSAGLPTYLTIKDTRGSDIKAFYRPGISSIKQNYSIWTPNVATLGGMRSGGGECMVGVPPACESVGTADYTVDFIRGIGSSAKPAK